MIRTPLLAIAAMLTLAATAVRAAPAHPDLNGVWLMAPQEGLKDERLTVPAVPQPSLTPAYAEKFRAILAERKASDDTGKPLLNDRTFCIPDGLPKMFQTNQPIQILQTPGEVTMVFEFYTQVRHVYLTGGHAAPDDLEYSFYGDSTARWEGRTLVVDTIGLRDSTLMFLDAPHSQALHVVERLRLIAPDVLEDELTMTDAQALAKPWVVVRRFQRRPDLRLREFICEENNRDAPERK